VSRARPTLTNQNPLLQGNNSEFSPIPPFSAKNRLENNCESSSLPDDSPQIPCATEQGINSTTTGNEFATIRELIRHNRESGAKVPTHPVHVRWDPGEGARMRLDAGEDACSRDELVFEPPEDEIEATVGFAAKVTFEAPEPVVRLAVPLRVDPCAARNSDKAHCKASYRHPQLTLNQRVQGSSPCTPTGFPREIYTKPQWSASGHQPSFSCGPPADPAGRSRACDRASWATASPWGLSPQTRLPRRRPPAGAS
jgi:hypothetical protein